MSLRHTTGNENRGTSGRHPPVPPPLNSIFKGVGQSLAGRQRG